jgi:hypothetical protein
MPWRKECARAPRFTEVLKYRAFHLHGNGSAAPTLHLSNSEQTPFCTLSSIKAENQMERSEFNGKAIESLRELVDHSANQQERSRQLLADFAEGHGGTNPSEEEKRVP